MGKGGGNSIVGLIHYVRVQGSMDNLFWKEDIKESFWVRSYCNSLCVAINELFPAKGI